MCSSYIKTADAENTMTVTMNPFRVKASRAYHHYRRQFYCDLDMILVVFFALPLFYADFNIIKIL